MPFYIILTPHHLIISLLYLHYKFIIVSARSSPQNFFLYDHSLHRSSPPAPPYYHHRPNKFITTSSPNHPYFHPLLTLSYTSLSPPHHYITHIINNTTTPLPSLTSPHLHFHPPPLITLITTPITLPSHYHHRILINLISTSLTSPLSYSFNIQLIYPTSSRHPTFTHFLPPLTSPPILHPSSSSSFSLSLPPNSYLPHSFPHHPSSFFPLALLVL